MEKALLRPTRIALLLPAARSNSRTTAIWSAAKLPLDALVAAGVQKRDVFADVTSGSRTAIERPGTKKLLAYVEPGDTVVVWRVDRLGRSLIDVLDTVNLLRQRGVHLAGCFAPLCGWASYDPMA